MNLKLKIISFCFFSLWQNLIFSYNINKAPFVGEKNPPQHLTDGHIPFAVQKAGKAIVNICFMGQKNSDPQNALSNIFMLGSGFYIKQNTVVTNLNILMNLADMKLFSIENLYFCQTLGRGLYSLLESKPVRFLGASPLDDLALLETNDIINGPKLTLSQDWTPDLTGTYYLLSGDQLYIKLKNLKIFENDYLMITPTLYLGGFNGGPIVNEKGQVVSVFSGFHANDARSAPAGFLNSLINNLPEEKTAQDIILETEIKNIVTLAEQGYVPAQLNILFADLVKGYPETKKNQILQTLLTAKDPLASLLTGVQMLKTQYKNEEENTKAFGYLKTAVESGIWGVGAHILVATWCLENGTLDGNTNHKLLNQVKTNLIPEIKRLLSENNYMISPFYIESYCGTPSIPYIPALHQDTPQ